MTREPAPEPPAALRLAVVPGVLPTRWARTWAERHPDRRLVIEPTPDAVVVAALRAGDVDAALLRLPLPPGAALADGGDLAAIPLYVEVTVVVVPRDDVLAGLEEVSADHLAGHLAGRSLLVPGDDVLGWTDHPGGVGPATPTTAQALELVAAGAGVAVLPMSLARAHHRKDVVAVPVTGAPTSTVALAWPAASSDPWIEELIGVVRGRTARSSRGTRSTGAADGQAAADAGAARAPATGPRPAARRGPRRPAQGPARGRRRTGR